jgi:hypothetical protein
LPARTSPRNSGAAQAPGSLCTPLHIYDLGAGVRPGARAATSPAVNFTWSLLQFAGKPNYEMPVTAEIWVINNATEGRGYLPGSPLIPLSPKPPAIVPVGNSILRYKCRYVYPSQCLRWQTSSIYIRVLHSHAFQVPK